jgi:undecaprenyl-diphosphatase
MLFRFDAYVFHLLFHAGHAAGRGPLEMGAVFLSAIGEGWSMVALVPLALSARTRRFAGWLAATLAVTGALVFVLKAVLGRGRPCTAFADLQTSIIGSPTDCSLPSGHAAGSFAFALFTTQVLLARRPRPPYAVGLSVALVLLASAIGVSRVVLGFHFPLDVLAGATLGGVIGGMAGARFTEHARGGP